MSSLPTTGREILSRKPDEGARNSAAKARLRCCRSECALVIRASAPDDANTSMSARQKWNRLPSWPIPTKCKGGELIVVPGNHAIDQRSVDEHAGRPSRRFKQCGIFVKRLRYLRHRRQGTTIHTQAPPQSPCQSIGPPPKDCLPCHRPERLRRHADRDIGKRRRCAWLVRGRTRLRASPHAGSPRPRRARPRRATRPASRRPEVSGRASHRPVHTGPSPSRPAVRQNLDSSSSAA